MDTGSSSTMSPVRLTIDEVSLVSYLEKNVPQFKGPIELKQFKNGQSNPTYFIRDANKREYVLRKKPPGKLLASAHMIEREFKIMSVLNKVNFPVPKMFILCEDNSIIGTPFYLMEFVKGRIFKDLSLPEMNPSERRKIYDELHRVLAQLHSLDPKKIGLEDFGKAGNYYLRQINTWTRQYVNSKTSEIESMNKLMDWLAKNIPPESEDRVSIVHGDFRLDNVIFHPTEPKILATLDWELSTFGHPYADLAYVCQMYHVPPPYGVVGVIEDLAKAGIPSQDEVLEIYSNRTGIKKSNSWEFYLAFSMFRLAAIAQGVYKRALQGNASAPNAKELGPMVDFLASTAVNLIETLEERRASSNWPINLFNHSERVKVLCGKLTAFMDKYIYPNESVVEQALKKAPREVPSILLELQAKAKEEGLWNLFLPDTKYAPGLSNLEYAPLAEIMGRSSYFAPQVFNCAAPDTGNMEVLWKYGSEKQKSEWLLPLLEGKIRSCFAMTEPDVASSDATNIRCTIRREGGNYIINGRKWWTTGASDPRCKICILMGKVEGSGDDIHKQQSMVLVPMETKGVKIIRNLPTFGYHDDPGSHCEVLFQDVKVPIENIILGEGRGFEIAQGRLGPGRIHHCMRLIGCAERAVEAMSKRALTRTAFGKELAHQGTVRADIAKSRMEIEQSRLLVLHAAHLMDTVGNKVARSEIAMIKVVVPNMAQRVIDRAIQVHGGGGVSDDFFLAKAWVYARTMRIADGPDAVHIETVGKIELQKAKL